MKKVNLISVLLLITLVLSCSKKGTDDTKQKNDKIISFSQNEPDSDIFIKILGFVNTNEGEIIEVTRRAILEYSNGNKSYVLQYVLSGNVVGSIMIQYKGTFNEQPVQISNPIRKKCEVDNNLCAVCSWMAVKDDNHSTVWVCSCSAPPTGPGVNACSVVADTISNFDSYLATGQNIANSISISDLEIMQY